MFDCAFILFIENNILYVAVNPSVFLVVLITLSLKDVPYRMAETWICSKTTSLGPKYKNIREQEFICFSPINICDENYSLFAWEENNNQKFPVHEGLFIKINYLNYRITKVIGVFRIQQLNFKRLLERELKILLI